MLSALEQQCGPIEERDLGEQLMEAARRMVRETYRDHLTDLAYDVKDSFLEELDELNLEVRFRSLLTASVQFTLLTRCGLDPSDYLENEDLAGIVEFSTPAVLHHPAAPPATYPGSCWWGSRARSRPMTGKNYGNRKIFLKNLLQNRNRSGILQVQRGLSH